MNLLESPWIPVRRQSGRTGRIAPWQVVENHGDPFVAFASARPDFDGALAQLLIGLLQTALAPDTESAWRRSLVTPPAPDQLRDAFATYAPAFELLGGGPRFFQDLTLKAGDSEPWPIEKLLLSHGMSEGKDHFVRTGEIEAMCLPCAGMALMSLQISAPSGGVGHRVSVRGGGPLTTLVWGEDDLFRALWLNVLTDDHFRAGSRVSAAKESALAFPWLAPTRTSEGGRATTFADVDPLQMYWSMPRRIHLREPSEHGDCGICGDSGVPVIASYFTKNYGPAYTGAWPHPLTPYRGKAGEKLPAKGNRMGLAYRDWLGLVQNDPARQQDPAKVVSTFFEHERWRHNDTPLRLWAFGYMVDNIKPVMWCEGTMPLSRLEGEQRWFVEEQTTLLVLGAREAESLLRWAVKRVLSSRPRDVKSTPAEIAIRFWQESEGGFYSRLMALCDAPLDEAQAIELRREWHRELCGAAERIFDDFAERLWFGSVDPRRIADAGNGLRGMLRAKKVLDALRLPPPDGPPKRARGSRQRSAPAA